MEDEVGLKLDALAVAIANEALTAPGLADKIDAFKALTTYYVGTKKINARPGDEDDDTGATFDSFQQRIAATSSRA
jgi:hypothetical protein